MPRSCSRAFRKFVLQDVYPLIGAKKVAELTAPAINAFADRLREEGRSREIVRRVVGSLGAIFREARRRGLSSVDPTAGLKIDRPEERDDPRAVIPTKLELQAIIAGAAGRWRPLILVAIFCGLRGSELRGLRWTDIDFDSRQIAVAQRADAFHKIGRLKSKAGYRSIPMPPMVVNLLREWKLKCPKGDLGLVFPTGAGKVESHSNIVKRGFEPIQIAAGVFEWEEVKDASGNVVLGDDGKPKMILAAKYGMHALRHACASLWIENGMNAKRIQKSSWGTARSR